MAKFKVGDTVIYVGSMERGVVIEVSPFLKGRQLYKVRISNEDKNCLESNLVLDKDLSDPYIKLREGVFGSFLDFSRINTSFKIKNTSNNTISTLKASNTIFKAYQFKPLLKFLNSDNRRILVADEVGLGKTIEAGHIMLELMARKELKNALIICPKSLQEKWQKELEEKFNFHFKIYNKNEDFLSDLRTYSSTIKGIVNYEKISSSKDFFTILEKNNTSFDFVLFDEAHRLRNHNTKIFKNSKKLLEKANAVVMLTATPIMIKEENLFNLLRLLDEHKYSEYSTFKNELGVNRPFIKALTQINSNVSYPKIIIELENTEVTLNYSPDENFISEKTYTIKELFNNIPLYEKIIRELKSGQDSPQSRVQLQFDISYMSEMNKIFSRTRKKEITQDWSQAIREPHTRIIELYPDERKAFDEVIDNYIEDNTFINDEGEEKMYKGKSLGLVSKKRQVASSVYGYLNSDLDLFKGVDRYVSHKDAKFEKLLEIINKDTNSNNKKLIVFAVYVSTLKYLEIRLHSLGIETALIHGKIKDRNIEIDRFKTESDIKILLSSEVGSEGLDFQFCDTIVNYDLPWNPMVVEQRIGRIDRFGQKSLKVHIYNLIVKDSIQEDIYTRLLDRIGLFRESIGDLEAILDKELEKYGISGIHNIREWFSKLEDELYRTELTKSQRQEKIDAIARAIITEQKNLEEISEGLTDTLTNDIYFKNEVENIKKSYRYVTEKELVNYLLLLLKYKLPTCNLVPVDEEKLIYKLIIPENSARLVKSFLEEHMPDNKESIITFRRFINHLSENSTINVTFSQETGYNDHKLQRINAYHPLIVSAMSYFDSSDTFSNNTFRFSLNKKYLSGSNNLQSGEYFMAIYSSTIIKKIFNKEQKIETLFPIIYSAENDIVICDRAESEEFLGASQLYATAINGVVKLRVDLIDTLKYVFTEKIDEIEKKNYNEQKMLLDSHKQMQVKRKSEYFTYRIELQKNIVKNHENRIIFTIDEQERKNSESILPAQRKTLQNLEADMIATIEEINAYEISSKSPSLLSLSYLNLY